MPVVKESIEAKRARREAEKRAEAERRRRGLPFRLPRWYEIPRVLPERGELLGSLHATYRTCSDEDCRCQLGAKVHGPYCYRHWRDETGTQHKTYVKRADLDDVREAIERRRRRLKLERERRKKHMRRGEYAQGERAP